MEKILLMSNNCKYIKEIKLNDDSPYFNNIFKQIIYLMIFFEFDEETQKNKLIFWKEIPVIISHDKIKKVFLKNLKCLKKLQ